MTILLYVSQCRVKGSAVRLIAAGAQLKSADVCRVELHVVAAAMGGLKTARRWLEREEEEGIGNTTMGERLSYGQLLQASAQCGRTLPLVCTRCGDMEYDEHALYEAFVWAHSLTNADSHQPTTHLLPPLLRTVPSALQ
jgi:hypothetical protein